jgi:CheY-like chemotaxis protein
LGSEVTTEAPYKLLGDKPSEDGHDPLGFEQMARDLAQLIRVSSSSTPFTLGIQASWGEGKSSLMGRLRRLLTDFPDEGPEVRVATFNAWSSNASSVQEGLIRTVLLQLDGKILERAAKKRKLAGLAKLGATTAATPFGASKVVDGLWAALATDPTARNGMHDLMVTAMKDWQGGGKKGTRLLVVLVDDLDRCTAESVVQVFEAMKLYLDAPGIAFVVGFDPEIVAEAIRSSTGLDEDETSRRYLEKIVHVHYPIPRVGERQARALLRSYMKSSGTGALFDGALETLVVEHNARNPRRIKGFINNLITEYQIDPEWGPLGAGTLIRWLVLRSYFRDFATLLYSRHQNDPIGELLDLAAIYRDLETPGLPEATPLETVEQLFSTYGLELPSDGSQLNDTLAELADAMPQPMARLARDADFVSLVEGLGNREARERLREKLQQRGVLDLYSDGGIGQLKNLDGMRIMWISDARRGDELVFEELKYLGAKLTTAVGYGAARVSLIESPPDAIVSDITRDGDKDAGFTDLERIRKELAYDGPAIFYTSRVTPSRRMAADQLGATITVSPTELFDRLLAINSDRDASA